MNGCVTRAGFDPAGVTRDRQPLDRGGNRARPSATSPPPIEALRFNDAASAAYHFVYDIFCDWYVEITKPVFQTGGEEAKAETRATTAWARDQILKLLHPFMPFITEELWARTSETPARHAADGGGVAEVARARTAPTPPRRKCTG